MGLNSEHARSICVDLETVPIGLAGDFIDPPALPDMPDLEAIGPARNLKDPEKIAEDMARRRLAAVDKFKLDSAKAMAGYAERLQNCSLDPDLCRIVALGWLRVGIDVEPRVLTCRDEYEENYALTEFWTAARRPYGGGVFPLVTFNGLKFDLPVLMRRSLYLGIPHPFMNIDRYRTTHLDLWQRLSYNGAISAHSLRFYAKRFDLPVDPDPVKGEDIAELVKVGSDVCWRAVQNHCASDVKTTYHLAVRLGLIETTQDDPEMVA